MEHWRESILQRQFGATDPGFHDAVKLGTVGPQHDPVGRRERREKLPELSGRLLDIAEGKMDGEHGTAVQRTLDLDAATMVPSGLYFMALSSRLARTCRIRERSISTGHPSGTSTSN